MENALNQLLNLNISEKTPLIVSVSGGVDSMVLLNLLISNNYKPIVVHFNHQTRKTNIDEQRLVEEVSTKNKLPFYVFNVILEDGNFHNQARNYRNKKLKEVAKKYKSKYILTAHHLDDLAETVLLKITRGSNLYGYAGIHDLVSVDGFTYLRPLLPYSKKEIVDFANKNAIKFLDDESNFQSHYSRNRIRHAVIPVLKQENSQLLNKFYEFSISLTESYDFIRKYSNKFIKNNEANLTKLLKEDLIIQREVIVILLEKANVYFNKEILNALIAIINNDKPNVSYQLSGGYYFVKSYDKFCVTMNVEPIKFEVILGDDTTNLPNMKKITFLSILSNNDKNVHKICYNKISLPLIARTRKEGDTLSFSYGRKKLKNYLIDLKIPTKKRDELTIITDSKGVILWVEDIYHNDTIGNQNTIYFKIGEEND